MKNKNPKPAAFKPAVKIKENNYAKKLEQYEKNYSFKASEVSRAEDIRTTAEMVAFLDSPAAKDVLVEARVLAHKPGEGFGFRSLDRKGFIESWKSNSDKRKKFREAYGDFSSGGIGGNYANTVGQDFTPLLGGPFYKQLYYYNDWLKMHQDCFYAMNHDPLGKATTDIITNFVLGKGFKVEFEDDRAQAMWAAFCKVNNLQDMMRQFSRELSGYGEHMIWKLPNRAKYIDFSHQGMSPDVVKGLLPRVRLIDPSNIVEIVTYPEDITNVLFYVWLTPTQYQIYTGKDERTGKVVQGTKLIYQQIPAEQMLHYKVNAASNEKRGRSDLFAALPYFKRLRDSVNYEIIAQQKNAAWAIDTTIEGDEQDIINYMEGQAALGTIPNAGSEYVHTAAIKREYLANQGTSRGASNAFEWCLSMISASTTIPISYYGTHLSGGQTRASAIVATEPVAKMFEMRQMKLKQVISDLAEYLLESIGINSQFEISMPEIITQDRSAKLKDLYLAETAKWICHERAAETAALEIGFRDYDYETEQEKIKENPDEPAIQNPLTTPGAAPGLPNGGRDNSGTQPRGSAVTSEQRKNISDNR